MKFTIVGQTHNTEIVPITPIITDKLMNGDIVYFGSEHIPPQWYRVYDSGNKGQRYWCVTAAFAEAVAKQQEIEEAAWGNNGEPLVTSEWQPGDDALAEQAEEAAYMQDEERATVGPRNWRYAESDEEAAYMHSHPANGWGL